jgi:hypothetical protein
LTLVLSGSAVESEKITASLLFILETRELLELQAVETISRIRINGVNREILFILLRYILRDNYLFFF